jgi:hypothetical protein
MTATLFRDRLAATDLIVSQPITTDMIRTLCHVAVSGFPTAVRMRNYVAS